MICEPNVNNLLKRLNSPSTLFLDALSLSHVHFIVLPLHAHVLQVPVTAMLPLVLFPSLGIMSGKQTAICYMSDTHFVFIGSFFLANAVERVLLHRRIAVTLMR